MLHGETFIYQRPQTQIEKTEIPYSMQKVKIWGHERFKMFSQTLLLFLPIFLHKVRNGEISWFPVIFIFLRPQKRAYVAETPK